MNIFSSLKTYASKWNVKSTRRFSDEEINEVSKAKVVASQYGNSVCFFMKGGDQTFIPLSNDSTLDVGDVVDLAKAHVVAMDRMLQDKSPEKVEIFNLGTGNGVSVLELIHIFEKVSGVKVNYKIVGRRVGDIVKIWAEPSKANKVLGWTAKESIEDTMASAWKWQQKLREKGIM